jgi:LysM repeat protein
MKKNPFQAFRRFFVRTRKYSATAARPAAQMEYDDDDNTTRLSGAFIIVLLLHIIAVVGVFAFARIKESRKLATPPDPSTQTKTTAAKTGAGKPAAAKQPNAGVATAQVNAKPSVPPTDTLKSQQPGGYRTHIVKEHETLIKIAMAYTTTVPELVAANKLKNENDIKTGQPLTIPEPKQTAKAPVVAESKAPSSASQKGSPAATPKTATPVPAKKSAKTYVVRKGDSALKIARDQGCSYEELVKLNNIKDPKKILPGQVLKLPVKNG